MVCGSAKDFDAKVGCPQGVLGRLGGIIMARTNKGCGRWVTDFIEIRSDDNAWQSVLGRVIMKQFYAPLAGARYIRPASLVPTPPHRQRHRIQ